MNEAKTWWKSKIFWIGVITTAIAILQLLPPLLSQASVSYADLAQLVMGILAIIARLWFTDQPTNLKRN